MILNAFGSVPLYVLGITYLDDASSHGTASVHIGICNIIFYLYYTYSVSQKSTPARIVRAEGDAATSGDEIANVNILCDDIVHVLKKQKTPA